MNWYFLDEKAFLPKVPGTSRRKGQEQKGHVSCRGRGLGFGISLVVWGGCLGWCGEFGARTWGIMTKVVGQLWCGGSLGLLMRGVQCCKDSKEGEGRWDSPDLHHSTSPYQPFSISHAFITLSVTYQGRRAAHW